MSKELTITLTGGARVDAAVDGFIIRTDQAVSAGGTASAPEPFTLFLASLGTCAGIYVASFCRSRAIPTDGIRLVQRVIDDPATRRPREIRIDVHVPGDFPVEYRDAVARAAAACKVKKVLADPPAFAIATVVDEPPATAWRSDAAEVSPRP
ncbi:MAG: osmotically inducible protein C [Kofleriaceae bacterium]|nr:MAG: osmotically inducible protein C [Kofleriaceae bacterium]MBZ0231292.1 OsmC family protein [Kofleriaceae bacterium]